MMPNEQTSARTGGQPTNYQIRIKGYLEQQWVAWFEGLTITWEAGGNTLLSGPVVDQAALHGLLRKVRDLGMPLLSVTAADPSDDITHRDENPAADCR
jgi:hypothetical protein